MSRCDNDCKVYVGDLGNNGDQNELEDAFSHYGPLNSVWVAKQPAGFAFIEFADPRDARDACRALDGRTLCGRRVRVEISTGRSRGGPRGGGYRNSYDSSGCYECGDKTHFARDCRRRRDRYRRRECDCLSARPSCSSIPLSVH